MADQITRDEFTDYMEAFEQRLAARFGRADRRLEGIEGRLDEIEGRFDGLEFSRALAAEPPPRVNDRAMRDRADEADGYARAAAQVDRLSGQIERCTRLLDELEDRLMDERASPIALPPEFFVTPDTRDERLAFGDGGGDAPANAPASDANEDTVTVPGSAAAAARRRTIKKANGVVAKSAPAEKVGRKATRREPKPRASLPPPAATAGRQRRSRT
jgi:hypothetical protein